MHEHRARPDRFEIDSALKTTLVPIELHHDDGNQLLTYVEESRFTVVEAWGAVARDNASDKSEQWKGGVAELHLVNGRSGRRLDMRKSELGLEGLKETVCCSRMIDACAVNMR